MLTRDLCAHCHKKAKRLLGRNPPQNDGPRSRRTAASTAELRKKIVEVLNKTPFLRSNLAEELKLSEATTAYHLKHLKEAGLVKLVRKGKFLAWVKA